MPPAWISLQLVSVRAAFVDKMNGNIVEMAEQCSESIKFELRASNPISNQSLADTHKNVFEAEQV